MDYFFPGIVFNREYAVFNNHIVEFLFTFFIWITFSVKKLLTYCQDRNNNRSNKEKGQNLLSECRVFMWLIVTSQQNLLLKKIIL